ncbi:MAG: prephenate dehydrogenase/arogenate dehydrogenase family protein [Candidatus Bathyarchaeia archaeon]
MSVAILGAAGRMGRWLVQYFINQGFALTVFDIKKEELKELSKTCKVKIARNNLEAVKNAELTVVSVPIERTAEVLEEICPKLRKGSVVVEIASVKEKIVNALRNLSRFDIQPLSLHPLFGPMQKLKRKKIALIPIVNAEKELETAKKIFLDAEFVVVDAEQHDRVMAAMLSLPYFANVVLASTLKDEDFKILEKLCGTTSTLQLTLVGSIMAQDPALHVSLHATNKYAIEYLNKFVSEAEKLRDLIKSGNMKDFRKFYSEITKCISKSLNLEAMYEKMYVALEALQSRE